MPTIGETAAVTVQPRTMAEVNAAWGSIHKAILELIPFFGEATDATHAAMREITHTLDELEANKKNTDRLAIDRNAFAKRGRA